MQVSPDGRHIDYRQAIQQVEKLFRRDFLHVRGCPGPFETSSFQALVEKEKTIAFPDNPLESVPAGSTEQEQDIRLKWVKMKVFLYNAGKAVDPHSEVCLATSDVNFCKAS